MAERRYLTLYELWQELGRTIRILRKRAGLSLREVERLSTIGRGTISQVENGLTKPSLRLVEWCDDHLHGDGLLLAMYAEAKLSLERASRFRPRCEPTDGDRAVIERAFLMTGALVPAGSEVEVGWTLLNAGVVPWQGRSLRRLGAVAATRLIASPVAVPLPDCPPSQRVDVRMTVTAPDMPGTVAAYWHLVGANDRPCFPSEAALGVVLVVGA